MINLFLLPKDTGKSGFVNLSSGVASVIKNNFTAVVDPTAADSSASGYSVGSTWINTALNKIFVCSSNSPGAAVWRSFIDPYLSQNYAVSSGTNNYAIALAPTLSSYVNGLTVFVRFSVANTGASSLNVDSRGAKNIFKNGAPLVSGDIPLNSLGVLVYNLADNRFDIVAGGSTGSSSAAAGLDPFLIIGG